MKKRRFIRTSLSIALVILVSSQLGIVHSAESMHTIQLTDYPSQVEVGDLMTIKGWVTFTQPTTNYPLYAVLVIEGSKIRGSAKWLPEGTVLESAVQLGTYTYDGNIRWVWYVPEIDNGVTYTIYALDRETAKIKSNTLTYTVGGGTVETKPPTPPLESFNFGITATSSSISIQQGQSGSVGFSVMLLGGTAQTVSLFISGLPSGCTCSLDPPGGTPPFSSTLIVNVGASTTTGSYPLTVTGTSSSLTKRFSLSLIVTASVPLTYSLIVTTQPSGIVMWRGADSYSAGSIVTLGTAPETVEGGTGIRYIFQYWKVDGVQIYDNPPTITMDKNHAAVAVYKTQYYLTVQSAEAVPSQPSGYQDANSRITVSVSETINSQYDSRYICKSYLLDDSSHSGNSACVTMDRPHNLTFVWTLQFYLILTCAITGPGLLGENWYDYGATATIEAPAAFLASDGKQYQFDQWVSTGTKTPNLANPYTSITTLVMNSSGYQLEAQYNTTNQTISTMLKLHADGTVIKDAAGSPIRLAGFNVHSYHGWAALQVSEGDIAWMKNKGFNAIRAVVYWSDFEKEQAKIDEAFFLNYLDPLINWCEKYGIYVVIDMHQWEWSPYWRGYGFPIFYCNMYANTSGGMTLCALDFWAGNGPGAVTQQRYINAWTYIANRYKDRNVIAAYDLFNEPYSFYDHYKYSDIFWPQVMSFFNDKLVPAIRAVDPDTMMIYDAFYQANLNTKQQHPNIAWGRSWYDYSAESVGNYISSTYTSNMRSKLAEYVDRFCVQFNAPFVILEIGGDQFLGNNLQWFDDSLRTLAELTNASESFFQWRYGKDDDYGWLPRNSNGSDKPLVAVLQKYITSTAIASQYQPVSVTVHGTDELGKTVRTNVVRCRIIVKSRQNPKS